MSNQKIRDQFNKQAKNFVNWSVGKNTEYHEAHINFAKISSEDTLLDVACGPGDFTNYAAKKIVKAHGVDISDKEIEMAQKQADELGLKNVTFQCADVEKIPVADESFSRVICKSAFHHFINSETVFEEMIRCCESGGNICIQDIVAYENEFANDFFEEYDLLIDESHQKTLYQSEFEDLFKKRNIKIVDTYRLDVELNVIEYVNHAVQDNATEFKLELLLESGRNNRDLLDYLYEKNNELYFKRPVFLIVGKK